ncbi:hypothetical protein KVR01_004714 [Diaporthe batatas]|uniref:uncharacterized protein n=1 Tax=Diaporthe batatas TaxID=748121 RepID=UPI001D03EAA0|nr:uncharacterized protein KVR01_004714 [Diaporthe batatas]KAG8166162.1 hypothetical protein KVR01_004714 [Diaporthe batatas]
MPVVSITEDSGDSAPDTILHANLELHEPLLQASTGSTVIPMSGEKQVMMGTRDDGHPPRPCMSSRLFPCKTEEDVEPPMPSRPCGPVAPCEADEDVVGEN